MHSYKTQIGLYHSGLHIASIFTKIISFFIPVLTFVRAGNKVKDGDFMENFIVCLNAVLPLFIILTIGYLSRCAGLVDNNDVIKMNKLAFRVFMPVLMFYNVYTSDIFSSIRLGLIIYSVVTVLVMFGVVSLLVNRCITEPRLRGTVIQGIYRSNFVIIGLPIASSLIGGDVGCVAVLIAIIVPMFNVLAVITLSANNGEKADAKSLVLKIAKNPLILGTLAGIIALLAGIKLPTPIIKTAKDIAGLTSPFLLFLLGAFFEFGDLGHAAKELIVTTLCRLIIIPAIALTGGFLLGFRGVEFVALIGIFASATAVTSFTMAQQMGGDARLAGNIVIITSALCSFTLFLWSFLFKTLGAF